MNDISLFKPHLLHPSVATYKGGKTRDQVQSEKKIFKLSSNENLLGSSPLAIQAIRDHIHVLNEYPEGNGGSLSKALSEFYQGQLSPDHFFTANSGIGIFDLLVNAFLGEGTECIISNPTFRAYVEFANKSGTVVKDVPLLGDEMRLDVEGILGAINEDTRLIWVCSPNNPTGTHIPKAAIDTLVEQLPSHVILVHDEVYHHFVDAEDYTTALPYVLAGKNVIGINSFSKAYGLAGMRIGFAYSTPEIAQYVNRVRRPFLLNTLALEAAKAALKDTEFIQRTQNLIKAGKAYLYPELDRIGIKYWKSQTNFILIQPEMEVEEFEEKMLQEGIMVRSAIPFGAPGCIRVTIGTQEANEAYIEALGVVLG